MTKIFLKDFVANELAALLAEAKKGAATTVIRCAFGMLARRRVAKRSRLLSRIEEAAAQLPSSAQLVGVHAELRALDASIADRALAKAMAARWAQLKAKKDRREIDLLARFVEAQRDTWPAAALATVSAEIGALVAGFAVDDAKAALAAAVAQRDEAQIKSALAAGEALGFAAADVAAAKQALAELAFLKRVEQAAASKELGVLEAVLKEASSLGLDAAAEVVHAQSVKAALLQQQTADQAAEEARIQSEAAQEKAAQVKAAQEKAAQEKAAQEKAEAAAAAAVVVAPAVEETAATPPRKISLTRPATPLAASTTAAAAGDRGVTAPTPTTSSADSAELERLRAENAKLKEAASKGSASVAAAPVAAVGVAPASAVDAAELRKAQELAASLEAKLVSLEGLNARYPPRRGISLVSGVPTCTRAILHGRVYGTGACVGRGHVWDSRTRRVLGCKTKRQRRRRS